MTYPTIKIFDIEFTIRPATKQMLTDEPRYEVRVRDKEILYCPSLSRAEAIGVVAEAVAGVFRLTLEGRRPRSPDAHLPREEQNALDHQQAVKAYRDNGMSLDKAA